MDGDHSDDDQLHRHGHVPGRHGDARHRRAALHSAGRRCWISASTTSSSGSACSTRSPARSPISPRLSATICSSCARLAPKEITLVDIYRSIWPFVIIMILTIALLMIFPQLALWLPERMTVKG